MKRSSSQVSEWWDEKTRSLRTGDPPRIEVYLRSLAPAMGVRERTESALEALGVLDRRDLVDGVDVTVWGNAVCPNGESADTATGQKILGKLAAFRAWGQRTDADTTLPFDRKTVSSSITDERYEKIVLPELCLGVFCDGELELVLPCEVDEVSQGVLDFLSSFEHQTPRERGIGTSA